MSTVPSPPRGLTDQDPFPPDCAARFAHVRRIAAGGFGAVYLAMHRGLDRPCAIKLLLANVLREPEAVRRFESEARITASLKHESIIQMLDHGAEYGIPWIAYEYAPGPSVRALLEAGPLPFDAIVAIVGQVADALQAAHASGIVHRDVKPDNVLEVSPGRFKLTDFGIARWRGGAGPRTKTGLILGTPSYVAPELVSGAEPSAASDTYALGVMLHELLTGEPPFRGDNVGLVLEAHLLHAPPPVSSLRAGSPAGLDELVLRALAKKPEERWESPAALGEALRQCGGGEPRGSRRPASSRARDVTVRASRPTAVPAAPVREALPRGTASGAGRARAGFAAAIACGLVLAWVARPGGEPLPRVPTPSGSASEAGRPAARFRDGLRELARSAIRLEAAMGALRTEGSATAKQREQRAEIMRGLASQLDRVTRLLAGPQEAGLRPEEWLELHWLNLPLRSLCRSFEAEISSAPELRAPWRMLHRQLVAQRSEPIERAAVELLRVQLEPRPPTLGQGFIDRARQLEALDARLAALPGVTLRRDQALIGALVATDVLQEWMRVGANGKAFLEPKALEEAAARRVQWAGVTLDRLATYRGDLGEMSEELRAVIVNVGYQSLEIVARQALSTGTTGPELTRRLEVVCRLRTPNRDDVSPAAVLIRGTLGIARDAAARFRIALPCDPAR